MIASLAMYDLPQMHGANDRFWAGVRDHLRAQGVAAPEALTRGDAAYWQAWQSPDLVLSQTCGLPYGRHLHGRVEKIATPDYGLPDCPAGYYKSLFVVRADDPRNTVQACDGAAFAYNEALSQSGYGTAVTHFADLGLRLNPALESGGHRLSCIAVAQGRADFAAIDAQTWRMLNRHEPHLTAALRVIGQTRPSPGLPFITAKGAAVGALLAAITDALDGLGATDREVLGIASFVQIPDAVYAALPLPPDPALGRMAHPEPDRDAAQPIAR